MEDRFCIHVADREDEKLREMKWDCAGYIAVLNQQDGVAFLAQGSYGASSILSFLMGMRSVDREETDAVVMEYMTRAQDIQDKLDINGANKLN